MERDLYFYKGRVLRIVDGDTLDILVDTGFNNFTKQRFRLLGIDTPELRGDEREDGLVVKKYVEKTIAGKQVYVKSIEKDSFGRWLATVYYDDGESIVSLNSELLAIGYAEPYRK